MKHRFRFLLSVVTLAFVHGLIPPACAQITQQKIGHLDLTIGGIQATVASPPPVIPKNIASGVEIVVTQNGQPMSAAAIAQYLGGPFQIVGEYSGPGLTQTVDVPQTPPPANSLLVSLPAVTTSGNYTLSNLRFVVNGAPVFDVTPSTILVKVIDQVLVTSVQTTPLTPDQIQAMGVVLDSSSFTGFQFTIGLQTSSQVVNISFPVVFDSQGVPVPNPLAPSGLVPEGVNIPAIIVPMLLSGDNSGGGGPTITFPDGTTGPVKIPAVLVIPGNVGFLKQFFSAQLYVSNGAPGGSNLVVSNATGTINLPPGKDGVVGTSDDPLSLPSLTSGPQNSTMSILAPGPDGTPSVAAFDPGQTGQAQWTIRGDKEGFSPISFDINATLEGLPTGSVALKGTATGGVLVRNPFFDMSFTVPGVVRKGELFNVFATVTNISQVAANNLTVNIDTSSVSGVLLTSGPIPPISTLAPGDSATLTFQFQSLRTGQVVADYLQFSTQDGTTGSLNFTLGVFANGTPLSPDTLVLPSSVDNLPSDLVDAAMRVLGQAWSVANAAPGTLPASVTRTTRTVVTQKALALAEAGLRQSLGESLANALRDLAVDYWGGSPVDPGFDQVLRTTPAGRNFAAVLAAHLADPALQAGGVVPYELALSQVEASGPNFLTFAVGNGKSAAPVQATLIDAAGNHIDSSSPGGTIRGAVLLSLGNAGNLPLLGLLTAPSAQRYTLLLTGQATGSADISISVPRGDGTVVRGEATGVGVAAGRQMRIIADLTNPENLVLQIDSNGSGSFATSVPLTTQVISPSGPNLISATVIGPESVSQAGPFGLNVGMLFDRIVDKTTGGNASNYVIPNNTVLAASRQLSGRLVFGNFAQPEGPYVSTSLSVSGVADQRGAIGPSGTFTLQSRLQDPGAVVIGRVSNAEGTAVNNARVTYENSLPYNPNCVNSLGGLGGIAAYQTGSDGHYQFRYVRQDNCGAPFAIATKDPNTGALRQVTSYVRSSGQLIVIDLATLGLGSVTGTVRDLSGNPVSDAQVFALSGTDPQIGGKSVTDGSGRYTINGITVGPVTVTALKGISLGTSAGNIERAGTAATVDVTINGGVVNVSGTITQLQNGIVSPVSGIPVAYNLTPPDRLALTVGVATTAADGSYSIKGMPSGAYDVVVRLNQYVADQRGVAAAGDNIPISLQIVIPATGTVNGKVTFPNGAPAAGVFVHQNQNAVLSNTDGTYSLPGVPVLPSQSQTISAGTADFLRSGQTSVVVNSATVPVNGANITLSGLGTAQFTVLNPQGNPMVGQSVFIPAFGDPCHGTSKATNASGNVTFTNVPVGTVSAKAILSDMTDIATGLATITQDGATGFGTMQFHGVGTVTGTVVDPSKRPALGAQVQLTSNVAVINDPFLGLPVCQVMQETSQSVQTDTNGNFQFKKVNVGPVAVTASQAFFPTSVGAKGTLSSDGATVNFSLQLVNTISGVLSGTVYLPDGVTPAGAGVQVTANGPLPDVTVSTDGNGFFKFAKIFPEGSYTLTASDSVSGGVSQMNIFLRAAQDATYNLRLKGTGTINVTVVDGAGHLVPSAFVTLKETDFPSQSFDGAIDASNQGVISFPNIFEGGFSIRATDSFGRGGRTSATLPQGVSSLNAQVQLTTTGTVQGHFYLPDGVTTIPSAIVQLTSAGGRVIGQVTTLGTGDVGSYAFDFVPAGPIQLSALDPVTGRTGIAAGSINTQDQLLTLNVTAEGLDTIQGLVTSNGAPQPGASVTVVSGKFQATTLADSTGNYLMNGVPEGVVVATASLGSGFLTGTASAPVSGDGNTLILNVSLRNSGSVTGKVVQADGLTPALTSSVSINVGGTGGGTETTLTDSQGNFSFNRVPAGTGTIAVQVLGGIDQGQASVNVPAGGTTTVQVTLNGSGAMSGIALDSSGNPTPGTIVLTGTGTFPYSFNLTASSDGTFALPLVLAGPFTAKLSANIGGFTLYGTSSGTVLPNQTASVRIQVQPSGTISGLVLRPDGKTPAVGANVTVQLPTLGSINLQAQNDGTFTAIGVPLGVFTVRISDPVSAGLGIVLGQSITGNGQTDNLGSITLDANALSVVATNPADGASGIGVQQPLSVTFSEPVTGTGGISVSNGSATLSSAASLSSDGKTITLQGLWPDGVTLALNVSNQITDDFGRQLVQPQVIHFTTVDLTPPSVVTVSPLNGAIQVPTNTPIGVTFNKALSTTASLGNVITVSGGASVVAGSTSLTAPNALTFTPSAPLLLNTGYNVTVNGAVSFGGNSQTAAFTSTFLSPDTIPPVLVLSTPTAGGYTNNARPTVVLSLSDALSGVDSTTAALSIDGQAVLPTASTVSMQFTPAAPLADGQHSISASVHDRAGNLGTLSASFSVDTTPPSQAVLSGLATGQILKGTFTFAASATDSGSGVAHINVYADGGLVVSLPAPGFSAAYDTHALNDGSHSFTAQAVDGAGNVGPLSSPVQAFVSNIPLTINITSPASGAPFGNQVQVTATTSKTVPQVVFTLGSQTVTVLSTPYQATFNLTSVSEGLQTIAATATAVDGSVASASIAINVDHTPPAVNPVLIAANPPVSGFSNVRGLSGATEAGAQVAVANTVKTTSVMTVAANDGSFSVGIPGSVGDVLSLVAIDAAGNSSSPITFKVPNTAPLPQVAQIQPANGTTNFPLNGHIVVRFTQPVVATSVVSGTLRLLQGSTSISGMVTLSNDTISLTFASSQNLTATTAYTVVVQDVAGNQTAPLFQSTFTTGSTTDVIAPQIIQASPQNGATSVPINAPVHVQFTEAMDPATLTPQNFIVTDQTNGRTVSGMVQVDATGLTAAFVPQPPYGIGRTINVRLTSSIKDSFGNSLTGGGTFFSFATGFGPDSQGPSLLGLSPAAGMTSVPLNSLVIAEFDTPLDVVSASAGGFQVQLGGAAISGGIALSDSNKRITFTPLGGLSANSTYTVVIGSQLTDVAGNPLVNPGSFTFSTGAVSDTSRPQITNVSPLDGASGVPTNAVVQLQFNKRIDPFTVSSSTFYVYPRDTGMPIAGSIAVSPDGLTAKLTPAVPLQSETTYQVIVTNGITDLEGQATSYFEPAFTTGVGAATTAPVVVSVSPPSGAAGVPVNARVDVVVSAPVSAASVVSGTVVVSAGGTPVTGTLSVSSDRMTVTFVAGSLLAASMAYTVNVSGLTDQAGNTVVPFASSFTTGTSGVADTTRPSVVNVSPTTNASGVAVSSNIVLTFSKAVDPSTVNNSTVPIALNGSLFPVLAGNYAVNGNTVTFTPLSPLPGNTLIYIGVYFNGVTDLAGNGTNGFSSTFTTAAVADTTAPAVVMVTPGNGATGIGLNATVVLTFSKSLNANTITTNNFGLLVNGSKLGISLSHSADNRVVAMSTGTLPATSTVTVVATSGVTDLSGNALSNFQSAFTTGVADAVQPAVVSQRPGNSATGVPLNTSVVLYLNEAMNAGTVPGALHVSQNGVLVSGTVQVTDSGQVVQFTPSSPWQNNALIQVFMDNTAVDVNGNSLNAYQGSFTTMADTSAVAPAVVSTSPAYGTSGVPTNVVIDLGFNEPLNPATVNTTTVILQPGFNTPVVSSTVSLVGGGTIIQITPNAPLAANTQYVFQVFNGVQGANGLALPPGYWFFTTGSGTDTVAPAVLSVSPPNGSRNVGDNIDVHVVFSKPIDPLTASGSSIQLTGGGTTQVADAISFSNNNQSVVLVPHGPLPDNTVMTLAISGVTDAAGNAVAAQTTQFTTGTGPDLVAPAVVAENPYNGESSVPLNAVIQLQVNEPVDPGSVNSSTLQVQDSTTGQNVAGSYSVSADGQTVIFVPSAPLAVSRTFYVYFAGRGITDLAGNQLTGGVLSNFSFTTGTTANTTQPQVIGVSPANGLTGVPINAQVVVQFSEPVDGAMLGQVVLSGGSGNVTVTERLTNGNQTLTLVPVVPLATNTTYTVTVAGVQDVSGNTLAAPVTTTFTTGTGADLTPPSVVTVSPLDGASGVPTNAVVQLQFSKRIDPFTVTAGTLQVRPSSTGIPIAGSITVSADGLTATFTPSAPLASGSSYQILATSGVSDLQGQTLSFFFTSFTTK